MNVNRRCKSEGSLLVIESDEEFTDAQTVKQRIFDELKRIIVPQLNLAHNNSFKCPFCCPELHESDSILYRCPICFQKATKIKKHREIVPYVAKSQPSFSLTDIKSEKLIKQTLAIEDAKRSASNIQEISNTLKQLYKARDLLDPVINEIILSASQLTVREIHEFRKDNYPICYITAKQFKDTSDVINMFLKVVEGLSGKRSSLPTNTTSNSLSYFNEIIVNTLYLVNKDDPYGSPDEQKVYVDKFVLKELIQLHEVLGCTIAVIQDAERKERRKPIDLSPKESESIELTRKLSAASKASLSHKQKTHKESKSKKYRSPKPCSVGASKDRECRGVHVKPVKRPLRAMAEMAKYKECSRGDKKQCKRSETDKECQKKGLFACCNRKKCKKEGRSMQDVNKKKSISFAESKDNVLLEFKIDGRPIQIKMDKNTKEYLVKSLQKSKALNITASDEKSPNAQESSNFINSVMLDRHDYCKKGSPYTVECNCDSDDSVLLTQPSPDSRCTSGKPQYESGGSSRNFETSSLRKAEDTHTQTKNSKTSMGLCKTKNAFGKQNGPCPFVCLNYARDTQTLHLVKTHGSQRYDSDSNSVSSKCNSGVANIYPKSDEESTGIQMFLPSTRNNCIWNSQKRLSDPDSKLFDQSISLFSLPKCNYQPESPPNTRNINDVCCQKENTQLKYNFENDDYRKTHKTSQGTETHCVEYTAFRCIAEKDTELIQSLESCNYSPSEDCSYGSLMRKYTVIHNQTKPGYKSCKGTSETSFKVYTALNAQGTMEQGSINQRGALNVCCKCRKKLQNEEDKGESTKSGEERNDSVAIQTSQHSLKESAVGSSQTEDKGDLQTMQKNASLQPPSEPSACFQKSNSAQTNSDLKQTCYKFPRTCNRGCLKGESRGRIPSVTLPNDSQDNTTDKYTVTQESTLKGSNEDFKSVQNDFNTSPKTYNEAIQGTSNDKCRGCLKGQSRNRNPCNTPQNNFQDNTTDNYTASTQDPKLKEPTEDFKSFQNDLKAGEMHFVCKGNKQCRGRAAQYSYLNPPSFPEGSTNDFENLQEETKYITCKENRLCGGRGVQTGDRIVCPEAAKGTQTLPNQCTSETEKESSFMCSAVQTNDEDQFSRYRKGSRSYQESENRSNNNVEKTDRHSCTVVTLCSSTSIDSKYTNRLWHRKKRPNGH
ncbi:uncharacterized protein LOC108736196 isoform X2 [Agrilus planipennis]|uniref:Uncharacterized protein LOC108736196 isoform X2 n=1 Tax=Agrilus planipennis TaxID=224129 RepID=A0A1W4WV75_AGRPL|nr:uncharacterized protein LOC108736196 isoform X2 [Agrilus planipennis]